MEWMKENFRKYGEKTAIFYQDMKISYKDLSTRIDEYSDWLGEVGIVPGEVVAILGDYSIDVISMFFALTGNGNIIVPIISSAPDEMNRMLKESYTDAVITFSNNVVLERTDSSTTEKHDLIKQIRERSHAGLVLFSSGSTGKPKAMLHDLNILMDSYRGKKEKSLIIIMILTFDHIGGIDTLLRAMGTGSTITIPESREPSHIGELIETHGVEVLPASPSFLNLLLIAEVHKNYRLSSLKIIGYGAEPMPQALLERLINVFPNVRFQQKFGTSETNSIRVKSMSDGSLFFRIDDPNIIYRVIDGELHLKSKTQIIGYLTETMEQFTEDGWFKTGDLVETTEGGFLRIVGRNKDIINVGGAKVVPNEVESILLQMPQIDDCLVYGEDNVIIGQIVACDIVLNKNADVNSIKKEIRKYCREKLDNFKMPTKINIKNEISSSHRFKKIRHKSVDI